MAMGDPRCRRCGGMDGSGHTCPPMLDLNAGVVDDLAERVWRRFLELLAIKIFGDKDVIAGHKVHNLLGSTDYHKEVYLRAFKDVAGKS